MLRSFLSVVVVLHINKVRDTDILVLRNYDTSHQDHLKELRAPRTRPPSEREIVSV